DNALVDLRKKFEKKQESDELKLKLDKFQTSSKNLSQLLASQTSDKTRLGYDNQVFNSTLFDCDEMFSSESDVSMSTSPMYGRYKSGEGYHAVPPPYTRTFMPPKPDLVFHDAPTINKTVPAAFNVEPSPTKPDMDLSQSNRPSAPIIEDWVSDSKDDSEEWRTHTLIWRNKTDLEDQSFDDMFNSLKIYEGEVKSSSSTSPTIQNITFVSSLNTNSTNESVSAVASVSAASTKVLVSALANVDTLSDAVIYSFFAS
nr:hypothetical protein [Tanacetum cinerariifolium]